jgi:hypothetical protein
MQGEPVEGAVGDGVMLLAKAARAWTEKGDPRPLLRWVDREVRDDGVLIGWPVRDWWPLLATVLEARASRPEGWPTLLDARFEPVVRTALRFTRPDGLPVFGPDGRIAAAGQVLHGWAAVVADPGIGTVAEWWFPRRRTPKNRPAPPPLPAFSCERRPLAMLRADWRAQGDLLAIDHRFERCDLELVGGGRHWLGPVWRTTPGAGSARVVRWVTGPQADLLEWSFRCEGARITRLAALLRGRGLALLAEQWDGPGDFGSIELAIPAGVQVQPIPGSRALRLAGPKGKGGAAQAAPLALPALDYPTERGTMIARDGWLALRQPRDGRRSWLPLLVNWDPARLRRPPEWRVLTVTERSRVCRPDVAFAARVGWGRGRDGLVIYRSLARPALRCFLGHPTTARFLIGTFTPEGEVVPLVKVEG